MTLPDYVKEAEALVERASASAYSDPRRAALLQEAQVRLLLGEAIARHTPAPRPKRRTQTPKETSS